MENSSNNRDFEQFVQQNADQYRMFPSEKVWKGIHSSLHTRRRWYGAGLGFLLLSTVATVTWIMLPSGNKNTKVQPVQNTTIIKDQPIIATQERSITPAETLPLPLVATTPALLDFSVSETHAINPTFAIPDLDNGIVGHSANGSASTVFRTVDPAEFRTADPSQAIIAINNSPVAVNNTPLDIRISDQATDNTLKEIEDKQAAVAVNSLPTSLDLNPLSIESVVNFYKHSSMRKRLSWEIYFVPTISYRKLTENTAFLRSAQSNNSPYSYAALHDVNSAVTHKPDMGMEFGFITGYPLTKNLKLLGGLQFNVSKYDIRAYVHTSEVATIALSSGPGNNSVSAVTQYRNFDGYHSDWLHTLYVSISAPLGAEFKISGTKNSYLGVSATLQPTYILRDRAYLISTDYKNYAKVPSLIRKWNVNTGFEAFAGYSTGKIKWKIGPQVRYQILSSFEEKYPVREHLFDFGLKVGIMLNN